MPMQLGIAWYFFENRQKKGGGGDFLWKNISADTNDH